MAALNRAAIDVGSNSILLLVVDATGAVLHDEARVVGLGKGLGDRGLLAPDRLAAADAVLVDYANIAKGHGVEPWSVKVAATSACRRAMNAPTWLARVQRTTGLRIQIVSGLEEARLTWAGSLSGLTLPPGPVLLVDVGGGSTELVLGENDYVLARESLEIGTVRDTESTLLPRGARAYDLAGLARLRNHVDIEVSRLRLEPKPQCVVAVAGTATTLAATALGLERYDGARVHGSTLTRADLSRLSAALVSSPPAARPALFPVAPERADNLLAGATFLDRILEAAGRPSLTVSDGGLRFGLIR